MTASVLQEAFADDAFGSGTAVTSAAFGVNATVGSTIEVWITVSATATNPSTVIDSALQAYTFKRSIFNATGGNQQLALYVFQNNASASKLTVTATWLASQTGKGIWVKEIGGVTSTSYDTSVQNLQFGPSPGTGANAVTSTAVTPTNAPALCSGIAMECFLGNGSDLAAGTGYTLGTSGWAYGSGTVLAKSESKRIASVASTAATFTAATNGATGIYLSGLAIYDEASGSNVTLSLSGQSATFTEGTITRALATAVTGQSATFTEGALTRSATIALTGQTSTFTEGSIASAAAYGLSGQSATFTEGTISASTGGNVTLSLSGQSASFSEGTLTPALSASVTGQTGTFSEGTITRSISAALSGQTSSFTEGSIAVSSIFGLTGQSASFTEGSLSRSIAMGLLAGSATFTEGTITTGQTGNVTLSLSGLSASFSAGRLIASGGDVHFPLRTVMASVTQGSIEISYSVGSVEVISMSGLIQSRS